MCQRSIHTIIRTNPAKAKSNPIFMLENRIPTGYDHILDGYGIFCSGYDRILTGFGHSRIRNNYSLKQNKHRRKAA